VRRLICFTAMVWVLLLSAASLFAFERRLGARPMGMGDAFTALADDMNAPNYNPAGLSQIRSYQGSLEYANLFSGLNEGEIRENRLAYAQPIPYFGGVGFHWNNRTVTGIYSENEFALSCGFQILEQQPLWFGLSTKIYYLAYYDEAARVNNDFFTTGSDKYQFGLDAGLLYTISDETRDLPGFRIGLSSLNLNRPDLGLRTTAAQPAEWRLGGSAIWQEWTGVLDLALLDNDLQLHVGGEKWFAQRQWAVRAGLIAGQETGTSWTLGGSYAFQYAEVNARITYAFNYSFGGIEDTLGIHRLALDFYVPSSYESDSSGLRKKPPSPEKLARIKNYLLSRTEDFVAAQDKLSDFKSREGAAPNVNLTRAKDYLHDALGKLLEEQDLDGFLQKLSSGLKEIEIYERQITQSPNVK
jgi:hypothetical protein